MGAKRAMKLLDGIPARRRYRVIARLIMLVLAAFAGYAFALLMQEGDYGWSALPAAILGLLSIGEFIVADLVIDARFPRETSDLLERLETKLSTTATHAEILGALQRCVGSFRGCDTTRISSTVHLRVEVLSGDERPSSPGLIQISDYTRVGLGGRRWRVLDPAKGIVGRCLRRDAMVSVNFSDEDEYQYRMIEEFGFTRNEVERHTRSARSYLAVPMVDHDETVGVLYFFSTEPQTFPLAASVEALEGATATIAGLLRAAEIL